MTEPPIVSSEEAPSTLAQVIAQIDAWAHEETKAMRAEGVSRTQRTIHKELSGAYIDVLNLLRDIPQAKPDA